MSPVHQGDVLVVDDLVLYEICKFVFLLTARIAVICTFYLSTKKHTILKQIK